MKTSTALQTNFQIKIMNNSPLNRFYDATYPSLSFGLDGLNTVPEKKFVYFIE